jgi:hypothetical protein
MVNFHYYVHDVAVQNRRYFGANENTGVEDPPGFIIRQSAKPALGLGAVGVHWHRRDGGNARERAGHLQINAIRERSKTCSPENRSESLVSSF